jgi:hypothetical protein
MASEPLSAIEVEAWVQRLQRFRNDYNDYWTSTEATSGTGNLALAVTPRELYLC